MIRSFQLAMALAFAATAWATPPAAHAQQDAEACNDQCFVTEEQCYSECDYAADPAICEDACRNETDQCLVGCEG